jgi:hypothetical protein
MMCTKKRELRLCGFVLPSLGFYGIRIPVDKEKKKKEVLGIMIIECGIATIESIEKELVHLFREVPKWKIKMMDEENKYIITFPSEAIRHQVARFRGFDFETSIVKARVIPTKMSAEADSNLEVVWVKDFNFPSKAKTVEVVMKIAYLVGDLQEVDLNSLKKPGPVRIKLACKAAREVKGETQIFFNGESHRIRWEVESNNNSAKTTSSSKFDRQKDTNERGEEEGEEEEYYPSQDKYTNKNQTEGKENSTNGARGEGNVGSRKNKK